MPLARERKIGVIAKRPIANAAWKTGHKPVSSYQEEFDAIRQRWNDVAPVTWIGQTLR
jgi:hypothetical protein